MIKILQITDLHLGSDSSYRLAGVDTLATFNAVLKQVQTEDFDLVMVTGDISAEANIGAYETFFKRIKALDSPVLWLPGNHDLMPLISKIDGVIPHKYSHDVSDWRIIMLDSVVEGESNGRLGDVELGKLKSLLDENAQPNVLVCLHHQPIDVGSDWLDNQKISDSEEFLSIIESDPNVRAVVWGHVHQEFYVKRNGRHFMSAPSTCIQFKANSKDFAIDSLYPGYRLFQLNQDGSLETKVKRVEVDSYGVDVSCSGY